MCKFKLGSTVMFSATENITDEVVLVGLIYSVYENVKGEVIYEIDVEAKPEERHYKFSSKRYAVCDEKIMSDVL